MTGLSGRVKAWASLSVIVLFFVLALFPDMAGAIPAFARRHRMSCAKCHAPAPRLKSYGKDYARNAFRLEDNDKDRQFQDTGDDILDLQRDLPVAVRFDALVQYDYIDDADMMDFKIPYGMKILSGGSISRGIGYYFYFYMSHRGEVGGIEDAYIHFNDLFGIDLDLIVGQFQVSYPLFNRELRLTFEDYYLYNIKVGDGTSDQTPTSLAHDRGFMATYSSPFGLDVAAALVNGSGKGETISDHFDSDDWKNVLLRLSQGIGPLRAGGFGYLCNSVLGVGGKPVENEHYYWGVDGTLCVGDYLQVNAQYLRRRDDNPFFYIVSPVDVDTRGCMVEVVWALNGGMGRYFLTFLYNFLDSDIAGLDRNAGTLSFSYLLRRNLRLLAESTYNDNDESLRLVGGVVSAF